MRKSFNSIIYAFLVLLIIYQDSPLGLYLGAFGYSFVPVFSLLLFGFFIIKDGGKLFLSSRIRKFISIYAYLLLISVVVLIIWVLVGNDFVLLGETVVAKTIKGLLHFPSYIAFLYVVQRLTVGFEESDFLKPIFIVFIILTIICLIEYYTMPYAFSFLHFTGEDYYGRIRLLTKESSWTSMIIYVYGILALYYSLKVKKTRLYMIITIACLAVLISTSSSKTLLVIIFISIVVALILNARNMTRRAFVGTLCVLLLGAIAYVLLSSRLSSAIETSLQWGSIYTRSYTAFVGTLIGLKYPFGTGTAVYLQILPETLSEYYHLISRFDTGYALAEINSFINATSDEYVTVKSGLLQYNMYWGIIGTIWFLKIYLKSIYLPYARLKDKNAILIQVAMIIALIMLIFSSNFSFEFWLLVSFVLFKLEKRVDV